jgi:hypothetical protein
VEEHLNFLMVLKIRVVHVEALVRAMEGEIVVVNK